MEEGTKSLIVVIGIIIIITAMVIFVNGFVSTSANDIKTDTNGWTGIAVPGTQTHIYAPDSWKQNVTYDSGADSNWVKVSSPLVRTNRQPRHPMTYPIG